MSKFDHLPSTLAALLKKLADPHYATHECVEERLAWYYAGCPLPLTAYESEDQALQALLNYAAESVGAPQENDGGRTD